MLQVLLCVGCKASRPLGTINHQSCGFLLQVHGSGPAGSPVLPGAAGSPRGSGGGGRWLEGGSEALAQDGPQQEASWEIQRQQRHRVPVRALQRRPWRGGPGNGTYSAAWWHHVNDITWLAHLSMCLSLRWCWGSCVKRTISWLPGRFDTEWQPSSVSGRNSAACWRRGLTPSPKNLNCPIRSLQPPLARPLLGR